MIRYFAFVLISALVARDVQCSGQVLSNEPPNDMINQLSVETKPPTFTNTGICDNLKDLSKKQRIICKKNIEVMDSVMDGAIKALDECQHQFSERRWNCSSVQRKRVFGKVLNDGTRESAFIHAIFSAGIAHAVTKYCSNGQLLKCGCDRTITSTPALGFQWAGCSHNIAFGIAFAKTFLDSRDLRAARSSRPNSGRALMNLHNSEAGRKVINNNMKIECKCHGVSGSCELKTCWRSMPSLRQIGDILKGKFDSATIVELKVPDLTSETKTVTESLTKDNKMKAASMTYAPIPSKVRPYLIPSLAYGKPQTDTDLVYLKTSPDFCERNEKIGSLGTHGRACNRTSKASDGCEIMCCGRGYNTRREKVKERCNCKFHWCCYVECQECWKDVEINTCL